MFAGASCLIFSCALLVYKLRVDYRSGAALSSRAWASARFVRVSFNLHGLVLTLLVGANLLSVPGPVLACFVSLAVAYFVDRTDRRGLGILFSSFWVASGVIALYVSLQCVMPDRLMRHG
jgi:uncharacterized membrane protein